MLYGLVSYVLGASLHLKTNHDVYETGKNAPIVNNNMAYT